MNAITLLFSDRQRERKALAERRAEDQRICRLIEKLEDLRLALGRRDEERARAVAADAATHVWPDTDGLYEEREICLYELGYNPDGEPLEALDGSTSGAAPYRFLPSIRADVA